MKPILFAGPSIYGLERNWPWLDLAPPARCGDVLRAVENGRKSIAIVDGNFEFCAAVWHKEIIFALSKGCLVWGAASMGALRAAECAPYGMKGIGKISEQYATGQRTSDADVALVHGPVETGYLPLTLPLVDVQTAIEMLKQRSALTYSEAEQIKQRALQLHYKDRTWSSLLTGFNDQARQNLLSSLSALGPLQKAQDVVRLIEELQQQSKANTHQASHFYDTTFFRKLYRSVIDDNQTGLSLQ